MRSTFAWVTLPTVIVLVFPACVGDEPTVNPSGSDAGVGSDADDASQGVDGTAADTTPCSKMCSGQCADPGSAQTGCAGTSCAACPSTDHRPATCNGGQCAVGPCETGFSDCDMTAQNGCETRTSTDAANCGGCGTQCGTAHTTGNPTCAAGACQYPCADGYAHCSNTPSSGCETNVKGTDANNCGACGHSCLGGTCVAGACQVAILASNQNYPSAIALDATKVYFANRNGGTINRVGKDGTNLEPLVSNQSSPQAMTTDGTSIFWVNYPNAQVMRATTTGAGPTPIGTAPSSFMIALGGGFVWWANRDAPYVKKNGVAASGSGTEVSVSTGSGAEGDWIVADAQYVFWTDSALGKIFRAGINDAACDETSTCTAIVPATTSPYALASDANNLYWAELGGTISIKKVAKTGGTVTILASNQGPTPQTLATDGIDVYWGIFGANVIRKVAVNASTPCDGTGCTFVADAAFPNAIAVDDKAVYWVSQTGGYVAKIAK